MSAPCRAFLAGGGGAGSVPGLRLHVVASVLADRRQNIFLFFLFLIISCVADAFLGGWRLQTDAAAQVEPGA